MLYVVVVVSIFFLLKIETIILYIKHSIQNGVTSQTIDSERTAHTRRVDSYYKGLYIFGHCQFRFQMEKRCHYTPHQKHVMVRTSAPKNTRKRSINILDRRFRTAISM
jgi:hypothetical protein